MPRNSTLSVDFFNGLQSTRNQWFKPEVELREDSVVVKFSTGRRAALETEIRTI